MGEKYNPTKDQLNKYFDLTDELFEVMKVTEEEMFGKAFAEMWRDSLFKFADKNDDFTYEEWQYWLIMSTHWTAFTQNILLTKINTLEQMIDSDSIDKKDRKSYRETLIKNMKEQMGTMDILTIIADKIRDTRKNP